MVGRDKSWMPLSYWWHPTPKPQMNSPNVDIKKHVRQDRILCHLIFKRGQQMLSSSTLWDLQDRKEWNHSRTIPNPSFASWSRRIQWSMLSKAAERFSRKALLLSNSWQRSSIRVIIAISVPKPGLNPEWKRSRLSFSYRNLWKWNTTTHSSSLPNTGRLELVKNSLNWWSPKMDFIGGVHNCNLQNVGHHSLP